jgi:hypothetical protein
MLTAFSHRHLVYIGYVRSTLGGCDELLRHRISGSIAHRPGGAVIISIRHWAKGRSACSELQAENVLRVELQRDDWRPVGVKNCRVAAASGPPLPIAVRGGLVIFAGSAVASHLRALVRWSPARRAYCHSGYSHSVWSKSSL